MILYTDKNELFECNIKVDGTSLDNTKARIVLESSKWNLVFYGKIDGAGKCSIDISKLNILNEGEHGNMRLEVIADDSMFVPWEDDFSIKKSKKVTVEVLTKSDNTLLENKTKVTVSNIPKKVEDIVIVNTKIEDKGINEVVSKLKLHNITLKNFNNNIKTFEKIITETYQKYDINSTDKRKLFRKSIIDYMAK
jgi:hypothetical protein